MKPDYRISPAASRLLVRARESALLGVFSVSSDRALPEDFDAATSLVVQGLATIVLSSDARGLRRRVYRLTPAGEEVARTEVAP